MKKMIIVMSTFFISSAVIFASPLINYQGRVTVKGENFTGIGYFKFILYTYINSEVVPLWSNDGTGGTNEPLNSIAIEVNNSLFNIDIGDIAKGMHPIPPVVFHYEVIYLRTWFSSDGINFEQLKPDSRFIPLNFSFLNTGNQIIVDDDDTADFKDIQQAIDYVATNSLYSRGIILMPGIYVIESPLRIPSDIYLKGIGGFPSDVQIIRRDNSGEALLINGCSITLENLTFQGSPAIKIEGGELLSVHKCRFISTTEPTIFISNSCNIVELIDCEVFNAHNRETVYISHSDGEFYFVNSWFFPESGSLAFNIRNNDCSVVCKMSKLEGRVGIYDNGGSVIFDGCKLMGYCGGLTVSNSFSRVEVHRCNITGWYNDTTRVEIYGRGDIVHFYNSTLISREYPVLVVVDRLNSPVIIEDSVIYADRTTGILVRATADFDYESDINVYLRGSKVESYSIDTPSEAIVVVDDRPSLNPGKGNVRLEIDTSIIQSSGDIGFSSSISIYGCDVNIRYTDIDGELYGIYAPNGGEVEIHSSVINSEYGDAVYFRGEGTLIVENSNIWGGNSAASCGIRVLGNDDTIFGIFSSLVGSFFGESLDYIGGRCLSYNTTFASVFSPCVILRGSDTFAKFNFNSFVSLADIMGWGGTAPVVVLSSFELDPPPVPIFISCSFEPPMYANISVSLDEICSEGFVRMANCVLRKDIDSRIEKIPPQSIDDWGNQVISWSWW